MTKYIAGALAAVVLYFYVTRKTQVDLTSAPTTTTGGAPKPMSGSGFLAWARQAGTGVLDRGAGAIRQQVQARLPLQEQANTIAAQRVLSETERLAQGTAQSGQQVAGFVQGRADALINGVGSMRW